MSDTWTILFFLCFLPRPVLAVSSSVARPDSNSRSHLGFNEELVANKKLQDGRHESCAAAVNERGCSIVCRLIIGATGEISFLGPKISQPVASE